MDKSYMSDVKWREFYIGGKKGVFKISASKSGIDKNKLNTQTGTIPYITRSDIDNGTNMFISDNQSSKYKVDEGNVITIGLDTQSVFYQKTAFYTGQNIQVLRNQNLTESSAKFIIPLLKIQMKKFNWGGNGATLGRLNKTKIMLPINEKGLLNWKFMEQYITNKEKIQLKSLIKYYKTKLVEEYIELATIDCSTWKEFRLNKYFDLLRGNQNNMQESIDGNTPLVSAKKENNGYKGFISTGKQCFDKNILTLNNDGDGGVGIAYYQPAKMALDTHVTALIPKENQNKYTLMFIARAITNQREKFSHGYSLNNNRLKALKIVLPEKDNNPDWQYMSVFMKQIENNKIEDIISFCDSKILEMGGVLNSTKWSDFVIEDICEIVSGKDIYENERISGNNPYITATSSNNGIGYFVDNINNTLEENCISVNRNGSVGYAFYHPYQALYGNDTRKLRPKIRDKHIALFYTSEIIKQREKYGYGYKMGTGRLQRQKIMLPSDNYGNPNYIFMKKYMLAKEVSKTTTLLKSLIIELKKKEV